MKTVLVTAPTGMVVSLSEAKAHLRVDHASDDGYIQSLLAATVGWVENFTLRRLLTQTWKVFLDEWPDRNYIELPFGQLQSVTSIKYKDTDGTEYTMDSGDYTVDADSDPGRVVLDYGESWPSATLHPSNPIYIEFVCGYGPHTIKAVTNATNASPIVVSVATHGNATGDHVLISSVGGNTNANGMWPITYVAAGTFSLDASAGNAAYTSGGFAVKIDVPEGIRHAIKIMVSTAYENRESINIGNIVNEIPWVIQSLLWPYRLFEF